MKLLIDTHLLIWAAFGLPHLPKRASAAMKAADSRLLFRAASLWEIAIKQSLGRPDFDVDVAALRDGLLANDYEELAVSSAHAVVVAALPPHHRDPFDRMLVAQAQVGQAFLLTTDKQLTAYGAQVMAV